MRQLHVVGTDDDGALLLSDSPDGPARFRVVDARPAPEEARVRDVRRVPSPAEIQARLRSGVAPATIARETGTDLERVLRWAAPVRAEMAGALQGALASHVTDGDTRSPAPLEDLVADAIADTATEADWQATRRADGRWRIQLHLNDERGRRTASWVWDGRARHLAAASERARRLSFGA